MEKEIREVLNKLKECSEIMQKAGLPTMAASFMFLAAILLSGCNAMDEARLSLQEISGRYINNPKTPKGTEITIH